MEAVGYSETSVTTIKIVRADSAEMFISNLKVKAVSFSGNFLISLKIEAAVSSEIVVTSIGLYGVRSHGTGAPITYSSNAKRRTEFKRCMYTCRDFSLLGIGSENSKTDPA